MLYTYELKHMLFNLKSLLEKKDRDDNLFKLTLHSDYVISRLKDEFSISDSQDYYKSLLCIDEILSNIKEIPNSFELVTCLKNLLLSSVSLESTTLFINNHFDSILEDLKRDKEKIFIDLLSTKLDSSEEEELREVEERMLMAKEDELSKNYEREVLSFSDNEVDDSDDSDDSDYVESEYDIISNCSVEYNPEKHKENEFLLDFTKSI